jgi:hypothetical protein
MALQIGTLAGTFADALAEGGDRNFVTRAVAVLDDAAGLGLPVMSLFIMALAS